MALGIQNRKNLGDSLKWGKWYHLNSLPTIWENHPTEVSNSRHWRSPAPAPWPPWGCPWCNVLLTVSPPGCLHLPTSPPGGFLQHQGRLMGTEAPERYRRFNSGRGEECKQPSTNRGLDVVDKYPSFLPLRRVLHVLLDLELTPGIHGSILFKNAPFINPFPYFVSLCSFPLLKQVLDHHLCSNSCLKVCF